MPTADQARQLAGLFSEIAQTVDAYRTEQFSELTAEEREQLEGLIQRIDDIHDQFTAVAIEETLNAIRGDLDQISSVLTEAQQALRHLQAVAEIMRIVSAVAELGEGLALGDYGAIPQGIEDLVQAVQKPADKNPSSADQSGTQRSD